MATQGTIICPRLRGYSLMVGTTLNTTTTVYNTYDNRKFSDFDILIFMVGGTAEDYRRTIVIPQPLWISGKAIYETILHGADSSSKSLLMIYYDSDTTISAKVEGSALINNFQIIGYKIGTL